MASRIPFWPSQIATIGAGIFSSNRDQEIDDSQGTHCQATTRLVVLAIRQTESPTLIPSSKIISWASVPSSISGITLQHEEICARQVRSGTPNSAWDCLPRSQVTKRLSSSARDRSGRGLMTLLLQIGQSQRWVPALVRPRFWSLFWQTEQVYL